MRAQVGVEYVTVYGWVLIIIIAMAIAAYYFLSHRPTALQCDFGVESACLSYQFFTKPDGSMRLRFQFVNGLGKTIGMSGMTVTATNIGKNGVNNYVGVCRGPALMTKSGDVVYCYVDITDRDVIPSVGAQVSFNISVNYSDCETDPLFPVSCQGDNRVLHGNIVTPFEVVNYTGAYCGDGSCNGDEDYTTCPWDCPPPVPSLITISSSNKCYGLNRYTGIDSINVTVYSSFGSPLAGAPVTIYPWISSMVDLPKNPAHQMGTLIYTLTPKVAITDSSGKAHFDFSWQSCTCCFGQTLVVWDYIARSGNTEAVSKYCQFSYVDSSCVG